MEKQSKMKKLLATASALAVLTGGVGTALGANGDDFSRPSLDGARFGNVATEFRNDSAAAANAVFTDGNNFINARLDMDATGADLSMDTAARNINSFNVYGHDGHTLTINVNGGSLGSVYNNTTPLATAELVAISALNTAAGAGVNPKLNVDINGAYALTLTGTGGVVNGLVIPEDDYTNLGTVTLKDDAAQLIVETAAGLVAINGEIKSDAGADVAGKGILTVDAGANQATFVEKIGGTAAVGGKLAKLEIGAAAAGDAVFNETVIVTDITIGKGANDGVAIFDKNVTANTLEIGANAAGAGTGDVTLKGTDNNIVNTTFATDVSKLDLLGNLVPANAAQLKGDVDFNDTTGTVNVGDNAKIDGNVVGSTATNGTLKFAGAGTVTGNAGTGLANAATALALIEANGAGAVTIAGSASATDFKITAAGADVTVGGAINAAVTYTAAGKLTASSGIVGNVVIANNAATLNVGAGGVNGTITAIGGGANATLNVTGAGDMTGAVGTALAANALLLTDVSAAGAVNFDDRLFSNTLRISNKDAVVTLKNANALDGKIDFTADGKVVVETANGAITGNVDNLTAPVGAPPAVVPAGTLEFELAGSVAGTVGATNAIKLLKVGNGAVGLAAQHNKSETFELSNAGSIINVAAAGKLEGAIINSSGADNKGKVNFAGAGEVIGAIGAEGAALEEVKVANGQLTLSGDKHYAESFSGDNAGSIISVKDGGELYGKVSNKQGGVNGTLEFLGDGKITGDVGAVAVANNLALVDLKSAAGKKVTFGGKVFATNFKLQNDSIAEFTNNVTSKIASVGGNKGTLLFTNTQNAIVTGTVGAGGATLKEFQFAGSGDVTFNGAVNTPIGAKYLFKDTAGEISVTLDATAADIQNVFENESKETTNVILSNAATEFKAGAQLAETGNAINFVINNAKNAKISVDKATNANFITATKDKGELELNAKGLTVNSVGKEGENIAKLTFTRDATVTESTYANEIDVNVPAVADTMVARFNDVISGNNLNLKGADSTAIFGDNVTVDTNIASDNNNEGIVTFEGNAVINKEFGALAKKVKVVNFANANNFTATLNKDIHATTINLNQTAVTLNSNVTLDTTTVNRTGGAFNIGANNLVTNGKLIFSGDNVINLTVDANLAAGTITANELDFTAGTKITIATTNSGSTPNIGDDKRIDLIVNSSGNAVANQLNSDNLILSTATIGFTKFTKGMDATTGAIYVMASNDAKNAMLNQLGANADATDIKNAAKFAAAPIGTNGATFRDTVLKLVSNEKLAEAYERIASTTATKTLDAVEGTTTEVNTGMSTRMNSLGGNQATGKSRTVASSDYVSGVSAGDDHSRIGAWFSPFYGQAIQKQRKGAAGYKSTSYGGTIGVDTKANADLLVGAALTVANSELSHRNFKAGDKTKINSLMFSVYGMYQLTDAWYAHTSATFGSNEVRNTEGRVTTGVNEQVKGKYTAMSFTAEAMAGYNHVLDMLTVTPMMGARYTRVNASGYKETGSNTGQNLQVSSKASNKLDIIAGARVSGKTYAVNDVMITPEIHGFAAYDLIAKNPTQSAKLEGVGELAQKSVAPNKFTYNVGVGVNAEYGMMEYGAGYDATLASKRVGHQGTLRLRVNF